jgi:branched-chain amino acid transport system ATP-binding protein
MRPVAMSDHPPALELRDLHASYGTIRALQGVSIRVDRGEIVALLGSNGAGKSTTLRAISGLVRPTAGQILLDGQPIHHLGAHEITRLGVGHAPEGRRIFGRLTVRENLMIGAFARTNLSAADEDVRRVLSLFPRLSERLDQPGGTLSGGEQQMLAIGRALMARPRVMLLDEPSMGLAPLLVTEVFGTIQDINQQGGTVLLVEQNAAQALEIAHRGYVLEAGKVALEGTAEQLRLSERVREVYLGG